MFITCYEVLVHSELEVFLKVNVDNKVWQNNGSKIVILNNIFFQDFRVNNLEKS